MGKTSFWRNFRTLAFVGIVLVCASEVKAAGEWEWTAGQGWVMGAGVSRPTAKEQLHYAYQLEQRGEFMDSARQYFLLVQNFPDSDEAGIGLQRLARCLFEMENYYTSYKAIEQVIKTYPNTGRMSDLVEIELRIAKKMMVSQTPDILSGPEANSRNANVRRALEIVDSVIEHDPFGPVAAEAYLVKGEGNLFIGEINAARTAFETVRDEFPRSDFVERARLGILQCDSLVGQATPQELAEQIEVVRESEMQRAQHGEEPPEQLREVDESIRQLMEVEAAKMMEQAEQYKRMGTKKAVESSQFLYNEVVRRYPQTPQADEAMEKLGKIKMPKEPGRIAKTIRNINWNPFVWNKDPEPPWILPQMDPEDMVMVEPAGGPILGVPETGMPLPPTQAAPGVRPATLKDAPESQLQASAAGGQNIGPVPPPPGAGTGGTRVYTSDGGSSRLPSISDPSNPLPGISEGDLIPMDSSTTLASTGSVSSSYSSAPLPDLNPMPVQPTLNSIEYNTPMSDLVGPAPRTSALDAPLPEYVTSGYAPTYSAPAVQDNSVYGAPYYQEQVQVDPYQSVPYQGATTYQQPAQPYAPAPQNGGWTFGDDLR